MENDANEGREPKSDLPFSHGHSFSTLDEYLEHLQRYAGPIGQPWFRQIQPDGYVEVTTIFPPPEGHQLYTRAQLARKFGFSD